jgi:thiol-disulfide isomerase/thioredoxin
MRLLSRYLFCALLLFIGTASRAEIQWAAPGAQVHLYFFWSERCPHCLAAHPGIERLAQTRPWLVLHDLELTRHPENRLRYRAMATELGESAVSVPAFLYCGGMQVGWGEGAAASLAGRLDACHQQLREDAD